MDPVGPSGIPSLDYEVGSLLDQLEKLGADDQVLVQLEWAYFPLLEHGGREAKALYRALGSDPDFFVRLVSLVYRGENERRRELDEDAAAQARNAWSILEAWRHQIPGAGEDGTIDREHLHRWVKEARLLLTEQERADIGDEQIGQILAGSPVGRDGAWPAEAVRELIEEIGSRSLETGIHIGKRNRRGATVRGVYVGGKQEHEMAARFKKWAAITTSEWQRTTRVLRGLAESYEREARERDAEAEARANRD
jgi:hypothetical protein